MCTRWHLAESEYMPSYKDLDIKPAEDEKQERSKRFSTRLTNEPVKYYSHAQID